MSLTSRAPSTVDLFARESIESSISSVKDTFSSWDSCMSKTYCKWPVIVGIIIGALILLSLLACLFRIIFCGAECCFCCAKCAKCLCCGWGSGSRRNKNNNNNDGGDPGYASRYKNNGYAQPPGNTQYGGYMPPPQQPYQSAAPPQYTMTTATFDSPSKPAFSGNADALPHMPSWSDATSRRVEDPHAANDDVELGKLNPAEPMLPKVEGDDYGRRDSTHGMTDITGDLGLASGAMAANPYRDQYAPTSPTRGPTAYGGAAPSPVRQNTYGAPTSPTRSAYGQQQAQRNFSSPRPQQPRVYTGGTAPSSPGGAQSPLYNRQAASPIYAQSPTAHNPTAQGFGIRTPSPPRAGGYGGLGAAPTGYTQAPSGSPTRAYGQGNQGGYAPREYGRTAQAPQQQSGRGYAAYNAQSYAPQNNTYEERNWRDV